jgi:hypothetical protein
MSHFPSSAKLVMKMEILLNIVKKHCKSSYNRERRSMEDSDAKTKHKSSATSRDNTQK